VYSSGKVRQRKKKYRKPLVANPAEIYDVFNRNPWTIYERNQEKRNQGTAVSSCSSNQSRIVRSFSMPADAMMLFVGWAWEAASPVSDHIYF